MGHKANIAISHLAPALGGYYALAALARIWAKDGHRVTVGAAYEADADLCILHHDRTTLDPAALPAAPAGVHALNGDILDISKRSYSTLAVRPESDWAGPVIIKTNRNHFGIPERLGSRADALTKLRRGLARVSWRSARMLPARFYPVLQRLDDVPDWVWANPEFIVEKFMPERTDDNLFCVRGWLFFGNQGYAYRVFATDPLVKMGTMVRHEFLDAPPPELVALREKMKFDFGKFDYVEHDGKAILLDANKTPTISGEGESPRVTLLARGIEAFV